VVFSSPNGQVTEINNCGLLSNGPGAALVLSGQSGGKFYNITTTGNVLTFGGPGPGTAGGTTANLYKCTFNEGPSFGWLGGPINKGGSIFSQSEGGNPLVNRIYGMFGTISSVTDTNRRTAGGMAWRMPCNNSSTTHSYSQRLKVSTVYLLSGRTAVISLWAKRDITGITGSLVCFGYQINGINADVVSTITNTPISISSSTNATPIVVTATAHGFSSGASVAIQNHLVNTAANGNWVVTVISSNTFSLVGSAGNGVGSGTGTISQWQQLSLSLTASESGTVDIHMICHGGSTGSIWIDDMAAVNTGPRSDLVGFGVASEGQPFTPVISAPETSSVS